MAKPIGSGYFAMVWGGVFLFTTIVLCAWKINVRNIPAEYVFSAWMWFAGLTLLLWGAHRVKTGDAARWTVGQPTINFVVGIIGATAAILALLTAAAQ